MPRARRALRRCLSACALAVASAAPAPPVRAQPPPAAAVPGAPPEPPASAPASPASPASTDEALARAKALFQEGNELRKIGDFQRALELYLRSRQIVASVPNTLNAAFCLDQLGRYDEALELYEALLTELRAELGEPERRSVASAIATLRARIGSVVVSSNVDGLVLIDGRQRGRLPLAGPIRLLPGDHTLRVVKDGWHTFERIVTVGVAETRSVDAKLDPLASTGRLKVEDERLVGADLTIDGALIGQLPWEGALAPGPHFYSVRKGNFGSAPREASVIAGQLAVATVEAGPLGEEVRVVAQPLSADLTINGVPVGKGQWRGALPLGRHTFEAHEPGYFARTLRATVDKTTRGDIVLPLAIDDAHPRWGRRVGVFRLEATGGYAFASSLESDAERSCGSYSCSGVSRPSGVLAGVRGSYEFPIGAAIELTAGYLSLHTTLDRSLDATYAAPRGGDERLPIRYSFHDDIGMAGVTVIVGGSYHYGLSSWLDVGGALGLGVVLAEMSDEVTGTASDAERTVSVAVQNAGRAVRAAAPFAMPELRLRLKLGRFSASAGLGVGFFLVDGPPLETGNTYVVGAECDEAHPTVDCAPGKKVVFEELAHGTFTMFFPNVSAGYRF
ncbi:putative S-layer-like protein [Sorangium cellulosum So ce56]|uniref:S-layer-like protein n=1 Tax=Sorangium cellulosum (strain So ce56) TaxID=448385 RepID=A9EZ43_SORC5|nr:PEGA domain-containing protein [Sorangium cellulosum]CAN97601.1 putative S-layer-like protein [Sorangium cellulosum So ce56]